MASQITSFILFAIVAFVAVYANAPVSKEVQTPSAINSNTPADEKKHRLVENDVIPTNYELEIELDANFETNSKFKGKVSITLGYKSNVGAKTSKPIYLNADGLTVLTQSIKPASDEFLEQAQTAAPVDQKIKLVFINGKGLEPPKADYKLVLTFTGILREDMRGFYKSKYAGEGGDVYVLGTQFQPTFARNMFPCFDEPELKATFDVTVIYPNTYKKVLFNTDPKADPTEPSTGLLKKVFKTTPLMPTYLLAIVVSKLDCTIMGGINGIRHEVCSRYNSETTRSAYSMEISPKILKIMYDFTGQTSSTETIGKVAHVALPEFSAGAMENWGLVTYRESILLYDFIKSAPRDKQRTCAVIAHELAHFWFGNKKTTAWWDHTWLNEGFATYFEYMACGKAEPQFQLEDQFVIETQLPILVPDSLESSKSLGHAANSPEEVRGKFGSLSYNKGASIIRMMSYLTTPTKFTAFLKAYIGTTIGSVTPESLWTAAVNQFDSLPTNPAKTLKEVMTTYVNEPGYPLLNVVLDGANVKITQRRFGLPKETPKAMAKTRYFVPITHTTSDAMSFDVTDLTKIKWLQNLDTDNVEIPLTDKNAAIIVNLKAIAYARVKYDATLQERIITQLKKDKFGEIHVVNRAQLVDDALNLARFNELSYEEALKVVNYLEKETSYYPWYSAFKGFEYLLKRLPSDSAEAKQLKKYILYLMEAIDKDSDEVPHIKALKKALATSWRCNLGDNACIGEMKNLFTANKEKKTDIDANIAGTAYCIALRESKDNEDWNLLFERYTNTEIPTEAQMILSALGCTRTTDLLKAYLEKLIPETNGLKKQDADRVFSSVISDNPEGIKVAVQFIKDKHVDLKKRFGETSIVDGLVKSLIDRFTTQTEIDEFKAWLDNANPEPAFKASATEYLKEARTNLEWVVANKKGLNDAVTQFINARDGGGNPPPGSKDPPGGAGSQVANIILLVVCNLLVAFYVKY